MEPRSHAEKVKKHFSVSVVNWHFFANIVADSFGSFFFCHTLRVHLYG